MTKLFDAQMLISHVEEYFGEELDLTDPFVHMYLMEYSKEILSFAPPELSHLLLDISVFDNQTLSLKTLAVVCATLKDLADEKLKILEDSSNISSSIRKKVSGGDNH